MSHNELYKLYGVMFNFDETKRDVWFPNGKDSIRVRYKNRMELVFTFHDQQNWKLETIKEFLKSMKEGNK